MGSVWVAKRELRRDGGLVARSGLRSKTTADHRHPFLPAELAEALLARVFSTRFSSKELPSA